MVQLKVLNRAWSEIRRPQVEKQGVLINVGQAAAERP